MCIAYRLIFQIQNVQHFPLSLEESIIENPFWILNRESLHLKIPRRDRSAIALDSNME